MPLPAQTQQVSPDWLEQALWERIPGARIHGLTLDETWNGTATKLCGMVDSNDVAREAGLRPHL